MEKGSGRAQVDFLERIDLEVENDEWVGGKTTLNDEYMMLKCMLMLQMDNHLRRKPASDVRSSLRLLRDRVLEFVRGLGFGS